MRDPGTGGGPRLRPPLRDLTWLTTALLVGALVAVAYLRTHHYPAYGAGLYLEIADQVVAHGYRLPGQIPHYTADGVPFAYPPLVFYVTAAVVDYTAVDPLTISRVAPPLLTVLYLVPYYFVARELLDGPAEAGLATVLLAVAPPTLQWHLSAGGVVRATGFLFALTGCYAGIRLFRSRDGRMLVPSTLLFGLTVLTHPVYTVFFGVSYLLFYLAWDRSVRGLLSGAVVALGGGLLAAPWWVSVVRVHGVDAFAAAAGTHSGLFGGFHRLLDQFAYPLVSGPPVPVFFVLVFAGLFYFLGRGEFFLPAWLVVVAVVVGKERFQFVAGAMMAAVLLLAAVRQFSDTDVASPAALGDLDSPVVAALAVVVLLCAATGVMFGASALPEAHHGSPSQPSFVDASDEEAMTWASAATDPSATFVVLGDAAEWFPYLANRTILVGPWGVEWTAPARYERQLALYENLSTCDTERCVTRGLRRAGLRPDYLYVPKGSYTVRGLRDDDSSRLRRTLARSDRYRLVYENRGVAVYRVAGRPAPPSQATSRPDGGSLTAGRPRTTAG